MKDHCLSLSPNDQKLSKSPCLLLSENIELHFLAHVDGHGDDSFLAGNSFPLSLMNLCPLCRKYFVLFFFHEFSFLVLFLDLPLSSFTSPALILEGSDWDEVPGVSSEVFVYWLADSGRDDVLGVSCEVFVTLCLYKSLDSLRLKVLQRQNCRISFPFVSYEAQTELSHQSQMNSAHNPSSKNLDHGRCRQLLSCHATT